MQSLLLVIVLGLCSFKCATGHNFTTDFDRVISRFNRIAPELSAAHCLRKFHDESLRLQCVIDHKNQDCAAGTPGPRNIWFVRCLAQQLVTHGYEIPVYVISIGENVRKVRIRHQLERAHFTHVQYSEKNNIGSISKEGWSHFEPIAPRWKTHMVNETLAYELNEECMFVMNASMPMNKARDECYHRGSTISEKDASFSLKHIDVHKRILNCSEPGPCLSNATDDRMRYALVLEEDQYIPKNAMELLVQIVLLPPEDVSMFFVCDSFHADRVFRTPDELGVSPYMNVFERNQSKTTAAYMISFEAVKKLYYGKHWLPLRRGLDSQFNFGMRENYFHVYHVHPPITGHGSLGLEETEAEGGQKWCNHCWEAFYNVSTMKPHLQYMFLS